MQLDEFVELVKKRRSIRNFKPDPIPDETLNKVLEAGRWAMSGANSQPWEFIVIKDQATKDKLAEIYLEGRRLTRELEMTRVERLRHYHGVAPGEAQLGWKNAPVIIAVIGDLRSIQGSVMAASLLGESHVFYSNIANATHTMQLAICAAGLGAQWLSLGHAIEGSMRRVLGVPEVFRMEIIVPIGYPGHKPATPYRRELSEIVHKEKYDMSKYRSHADVTEYIAKLRGKTSPAYVAGHGWEEKK